MKNRPPTVLVNWLSRLKDNPWPPPPKIIDVLLKVTHADPTIAAEGREEAEALVLSWYSHEDVDLLKAELGVKRGRGNKRTMRQAKKEHDLIRVFMRKLVAGFDDPCMETVRELFPAATYEESEAHRKKIEDYVKRWSGTRNWFELAGEMRALFINAMRDQVTSDSDGD